MFQDQILLSDLIVRIFLIVFWVFIVIYLLKGLIKGYKKMTVRLGFLVLSALLSLLLTFLLSDALLGLAKNIVAKINDDVVQELFVASPTLLEYAYAIATCILGPILFVILFIIISVLMLIPGLFVNRAIKKITTPEGEEPAKKTWAERLIGMGVGLLMALVVSGCYLMPIVGYMSLGSEIYVVAEEHQLTQEIPDKQTFDGVIQNVDTANKSKVIGFERWLTRPLFNSLTKIRTSNGSSGIMEEIGVYSTIYYDVMEISNNQTENILDFDFALIDNIVDDATKSDSLRAVLAEILSYGSKKWVNGESFLTLNIKEMLGVGDDLDGAINVLFEDLTVTNEQKVASDIKNLTATLKTVATIADSLMSLQLDNIQTIDLTPLEECISVVEGDDKLKGVLSELLSTAGEKWYNGQQFLNIDVTQNVPSDLRNSLNVVFKEFSKTQKTTVCDDARNFVEAIYVMSDLVNTISAMNFDDYQSFDTQQLDDIIKTVDSNDLVVKVVAVLMNDAGHAWDENPPREFMSINLKADLPQEYSHAFDANIKEFKTANERNVVSYLSHFSDTLKAYKYIVNLSSQNASQESLKGDMENFIISVNQDNVDILKQTMSEEILQGAGISKNDSVVVGEIVKLSMDNLSTMTEEQKRQEAEHLNVFVNYSKELEQGGSVTTTDTEFIDAVVNSESLSSAVQSYGELGNTAQINGDQNMMNALDNYDTQGNPETQKTIDALKNLISVPQN